LVFIAALCCFVRAAASRAPSRVLKK